jgi:hypothetical protein
MMQEPQTLEELEAQWANFVAALDKFLNETLPAILKPIIEFLESLAPYARHWAAKERALKGIFQRHLQLEIIALSSARLQSETQ